MCTLSFHFITNTQFPRGYVGDNVSYSPKSEWKKIFDSSIVCATLNRSLSSSKLRLSVSLANRTSILSMLDIILNALSETSERTSWIEINYFVQPKITKATWSLKSCLCFYVWIREFHTWAWQNSCSNSPTRWSFVCRRTGEQLLCGVFEWGQFR